KMVETLDAGVPVEVLPFAAGTVFRRLEALGADAVLREGVRKDGPVITDNGNFIIDCGFGAITDPGRLEVEIGSIPGVMGCGLFSIYGEKITVIVGEENCCRVLSLG
ncbi:MAG TPA: ribose-5-phosphate isomerase A, partial [Methanoculleus sp.]|nr:ribose-5-phosphate isomerase A [Methanoculleus sp.]